MARTQPWNFHPFTSNRSRGAANHAHFLATNLVWLWKRGQHNRRTPESVVDDSTGFDKLVLPTCGYLRHNHRNNNRLVTTATARGGPITNRSDGQCMILPSIALLKIVESHHLLSVRQPPWVIDAAERHRDRPYPAPPTPLVEQPRSTSPRHINGPALSSASGVYRMDDSDPATANSLRYLHGPTSYTTYGLTRRWLFNLRLRELSPRRQQGANSREEYTTGEYYWNQEQYSTTGTLQAGPTKYKPGITRRWIEEENKGVVVDKIVVEAGPVEEDGILVVIYMME
ncbi:hypothetical protein EV426DRAFT_578048 [Tirmania nivea]|nr:hypothetical protein EV426DRAFT_578048 [Tirmania nivea]